MVPHRACALREFGMIYALLNKQKTSSSVPTQKRALHVKL